MFNFKVIGILLVYATFINIVPIILFDVNTDTPINNIILFFLIMRVSYILHKGEKNDR